MIPLSQRYSGWKDIKLGTSRSTTIGSHGCLITCLAMLADLTPDKVNERLLKVNGYANTNLVIWDKIDKAIPWLKFEWRGYNYKNEEVLKNIPCLVEVDFDGVGSTRDTHWVLFTGNQRLYDPWTGRECSTDKYKILTGYAVIKKTGEKPMATSDYYKGLDLNNKESMKLCVDVWDDLKNNKYVKKEEYDKLTEALKNEVAASKERINEEKKRYKEFMQKLATKLSCGQNEPEVLEQITRLIQVEDKQPELEKENQTLKEKLNNAGNTGEVIIKNQKHDHPKWMYKLRLARLELI